MPAITGRRNSATVRVAVLGEGGGCEGIGLREQTHFSVGFAHYNARHSRGHAFTPYIFDRHEPVRGDAIPSVSPTVPLKLCSFVKLEF
jgi:hypothetical protein